MNNDISIWRWENVLAPRSFEDFKITHLTESEELLSSFFIPFYFTKKKQFSSRHFFLSFIFPVYGWWPASNFFKTLYGLHFASKRLTMINFLSVQSLVALFYKIMY